ncbi:MAG: tetratricopeptide repeat protein [Treponema sp.]|nr:tetratricopeptide repeat protein [Candidatus Treponema equi]
MGSLGFVVVAAFLIAVICAVSIVIFKNFLFPSKLEGIPRMLKEGKYQAAQRCSKAVIAQNPRNYVAHYYLGRAYLLDNKHELAFMEFKTVNQNALFNGEIPEAEFRSDMAMLYSRFNQKTEALKEYLLLTKLEPNNASNYFKAAELYEETGNAKLAMGFYQKTILSDRKNYKAYTAAGRLLFKNKNYTQARQALESSIKLNPESYENYYYLGKVCKETKDLPTAVKLLEKAERSQEFKQKALVEKGICLMMAEQNDKAADAFERAISNTKDPKNQETLYARYFLGVCYEKNRKIEKAIEQWEAVFKINSKFKDVASKLSQYKEIETNDGIKEYLTANNAQFNELCKKIVAAGYGLVCQKIESTKYGCQMIATEEKKESWMNAKQQFILIQFYRATEPIEDTVVRKMADTLKARNYIKGYVFTCSDFTPSAQSFSDSRPIVLVSKDILESLFKKAGM